MKRGAALLKFPGRLAVLGPAFSDGSAKHFGSEAGSKRNMGKSVPVAVMPPTGSRLPGIFPGLFTLPDSGNKPPTQNEYVIKTSSLLIVHPLLLTFLSSED